MTRTPLILVVVGALALGACGGSDDGSGGSGGGTGTGASSGRDKAFEGALKFSRCMREHGLDFPDPQRSANGGIKVTGGKLNPNDPKTKAAEKDCRKHMNFGGGRAVDPAQAAERKGALLAYARCMRGEGIDMPDPQFANGGATFKLQTGKGNAGSAGPRPDSPKFKAADKVCRPHLAELERSLGGGPGTSKDDG